MTNCQTYIHLRILAEILMHQLQVVIVGGGVQTEANLNCERRDNKRQLAPGPYDHRECRR